MEIRTKTIISVICVLLVLSGCEQPNKAAKHTIEIVKHEDLGVTIGSMANLFTLDTIPVKGYALVAGLKGAGSAQCPPGIRAYLKKYIITQTVGSTINVEKLINSPNTAVVILEGLMPAAISKYQRFDIKITVLPGTQTTSIDGGYLLGAELFEAVMLGASIKVLATAKGPVFINKIETSQVNEKSGYILGGGTVLDEYKIRLTLDEKDYKTANNIRNLINGRFEESTATAVSSKSIDLKVPSQYRKKKQKFISLVKAMYLVQDPQLRQKRINYFIRKLATSEQKYQSEIALEAIGKDSLGKLNALLNSSDERVRLHAARCMLNMEDDRALNVLRRIATDGGSVLRAEAIDAIVKSANRHDAVVLSRKLLVDEDSRIRLTAYENLRKLEDIMVSRELIGGNFYLEQIARSKVPIIFVSRNGQPRIALFNAPIFCNENIFVRSADGNITINAPTGQPYVSIIRKHPTKLLEEPMKLKSSFKLSDIIRTLCEEPVKRGESVLQPGLGVSYADITALLKEMVDKGAVDAEFLFSGLPKI